MKTNLRLGRRLLEDGYDLMAIAECLVDSSLSVVFHSDESRQIFSHNELEKNACIKPSVTILFQTANKPFFFMVNPSVFEYFNIEINLNALVPKDINYYSKENILKLTTRRRNKIYAVINNQVDISLLIEQGEKMRPKSNYICEIEESGDLLFFFCDTSIQSMCNVNINFSLRQGIESNKITDDYSLEFKMCPVSRVSDFISISKCFFNVLELEMILKENSNIVNQIYSKSTCHASKIILNKYGYDYSAEAQNHEFRNNYMLLNGYPLWMIKEHDSFKCPDLFSDNYLCYNKWAMFVANNAFEYFMDGNKLKFLKDYFIFDFDLYSKLYYFNDKDLARKKFINMLSEYRYDIQKIESIWINNNKNNRTKIIEFLIEFYDKFSKSLNGDEYEDIGKGIQIYILKLKGLKSDEAWSDIVGVSKKESSKTSVTRILEKIKKFADKNKLPYLDFKEVILIKRFKEQFLDDDTLEVKITNQIENCSDIEAQKIIRELDTSFLR